MLNYKFSFIYKVIVNPIFINCLSLDKILTFPFFAGSQYGGFYSFVFK